MTHEGTITAAQLQTIYQVMVKRIAKGFSAKSLSFFISEDENYVEDVESLQMPVYSAEDLTNIALILEENNPKSFHAGGQDDTELKVIVNKEVDKNNVVHSYAMLDKDLVPRQLFMLREDITLELDEEINTCADLELATDAMDLLLRSSYLFEGKSAAKIYQCINDFIYPPLNPLYIKMAIERCCGRGADAKELIVLDDILYGRRYEEC